MCIQSLVCTYGRHTSHVSTKCAFKCAFFIIRLVSDELCKPSNYFVIRRKRTNGDLQQGWNADGEIVDERVNISQWESLQSYSLGVTNWSIYFLRQRSVHRETRNSAQFWIVKINAAPSASDKFSRQCAAESVVNSCAGWKAQKFRHETTRILFFEAGARICGRWYYAILDLPIWTRIVASRTRLVDAFSTKYSLFRTICIFSDKNGIKWKLDYLNWKITGSSTIEF